MGVNIMTKPKLPIVEFARIPEVLGILANSTTGDYAMTPSSLQKSRG